MKGKNPFSDNKENAFTSKSAGPGEVKPEKVSAASFRRRALSRTNIHILALDGVVNVNSLFTLALFLGLNWYPTFDPQTTLIDVADSACAAGSRVTEGLITNHVYSFSAFLFSSLIALTLKQAIKIKEGGGPGDLEGFHLGHVNQVALRLGMMVSAAGSVFGCGFLMLALVDLVQIKLGTLACGSVYTFAAVVPLVILVPLALIVYVTLVLHAFTR